MLAFDEFILGTDLCMCHRVLIGKACHIGTHVPFGEKVLQIVVGFDVRIVNVLWLVDLRNWLHVGFSLRFFVRSRHSEAFLRPELLWLLHFLR